MSQCGELENDEIVENEEEVRVKSSGGDNRYNPSRIINSLGFGPYQFFIISYAGVIFCAEACEITMLSLLLPEIKDKWNLNKTEESLAGSIVFIGMFIGNFTWGILGDIIGRRMALGLSNSLLVVAGGLRAISPTFWIFNLFGFISGFAIGGGVVAFTLYIECLPKRNRGITLLNFELFWVFGAIFESLLGWIILSGYIFETHRWNWFVFFTLVPVVLGVFYLPFTPESLRYLYLKKDEYGMRSLTKTIERMNCRRLPKDYVIDFDMKDSSEKKKIYHLGCNDILRDFCTCKSFFLIFALSIFYVSSSFCYYGVVLASPGFFSDDDDDTSFYRYLACFISSIAELPGILIGSVFLCVFSRKFTQFAAFMASGLSLLLLAFPNMPKSWYLVMGFAARASVMASSSIIWVISQESLPTTIRSIGCGIASSAGKLATILSPLVAEEFTENNELIPKIIFAVVSVVAGVLVLCYPIETKGRNLADFVGEVKVGEDEEDIELEDKIPIEGISETSSLLVDGDHGSDGVNVDRVTEMKEIELEDTACDDPYDNTRGF